MKRPVEWVNPLIDTANRRFFFFSSACRPFGMVNLSPDTLNEGAWGSGYRYDEPYVLWFSHVHAWQLSGLPVLPTTGVFRGHLGKDVYRSSFSHEDEVVQPGYHALTLQDYRVRAEMTATDRVGFHRYTFPRADQAAILFDLGAEVGPSRMSDARVRCVSNRVLEGYVENDATRRRPKRTRIYFVAVLDKAFDSLGAWRDGELLGDVDEVSGPGCGAYVRYRTQEGEVLQLKVALSYCSVEQARLNLEAELPGWDFDGVRQDARETWDRWLGRIEVQGGTEARTTKFYTDLYHALLGRRTVSDVDGSYLDNTGKQPVVRRIPVDKTGKPRYVHHNSDAFWGAQWTLNVLWPLAYPQKTHDFCNTLIDVYKNGGLIPRGPTGGNYSFVMISPTSTPLLVSAYQKGVRSFDVEAAYEGMVVNHGPGGLMSKAGYEHDTNIGGGVEVYIERGYVPLGIQAHAFHCDGAAQTLEYAYCDWCLSEMARALGMAEDAKRFGQRALNYRNLYDAESAFMRPREMDGSWLEAFDPMSPVGWCEANGWQYLWHVPHDPAGLIALMGGRETFVRRLDEMMARAAEHDFIAPHGEHHKNVLDYGNQPSTYIAHLFNYAGAPWLTQKWVRRVMDQAKSDITPYGGYGGDEDQGQMGALNALMAMGLFSVNGGCSVEPFYEITSPVFERIVIHLDPRYYEGGQFVIEVERSSEDDLYIQSARLNGRVLQRPWFYHRELASGGKLELVLGPEPNEAWGSRVEDAPPSMSGLS